MVWYAWQHSHATNSICRPFRQDRSLCPLLTLSKPRRQPLRMSAFGGKADIGNARSDVGFWPKADLVNLCEGSAFWTAASPRLYAHNERLSCARNAGNDAAYYVIGDDSLQRSMGDQCGKCG